MAPLDAQEQDAIVRHVARATAGPELDIERRAHERAVTACAGALDLYADCQSDMQHAELTRHLAKRLRRCVRFEDVRL